MFLLNRKVYLIILLQKAGKISLLVITYFIDKVVDNLLNLKVFGNAIFPGNKLGIVRSQKNLNFKN